MVNLLELHIDEFKTEISQLTSDYYEYKFNMSQLPDVTEYTYHNNITKHTVFETMFRDLNKVKTNCLYWFSVNSIEEARNLKEIINTKKSELWNEDRTICRVLPAKNSNDNSMVLYVGARRGSIAKKQKITNIAGRIVQHFGYYEKGSTQGLQLAYFSKELDINVTLHLYSLPNCPNEYLYVLEKIFAKKMRPICGTH